MEEQANSANISTQIYGINLKIITQNMCVCVVCYRIYSALSYAAQYPIYAAILLQLLQGLLQCYHTGFATCHRGRLGRVTSTAS